MMLPSPSISSRLRTAGLAAPLLLAGCISMQGIAPHSVAVAPSQLEAGKAISSTAKIEWPKETWWHQYHDGQLDSLVAKAISDNPSLKMAQARVALSQAYAEMAHAQTLPSIGGDAAVTREHFTQLQFIPPPWAGNTDWNNRATASLAYDLDLWGRQEDVTRAALDEVHASAAETQQVKLELSTAVVRTYIRLAGEFALRDIAVERIASAEHRIAISKRALAAGLATRLSVDKSEIPLPVARMEVTRIDARIALLRSQLAALTGQGPGGGDGIARPALSYEISIGLPDQLPANLIGRRPDILANRWRIEASHEYIQSAKAAFYPNINLIAFIGLQALGFGHLLSSAASIAGVGPAVSLPIYDGGKRRGDLSAQTAGYDIAVEHYNAGVLKALEEISNQLVLLKANESEAIHANEALTKAQTAHRLALRNYQAGLSNYDDALDTYGQVLQQRQTLVILQAEKLDAHAGLMLALGGGVLDASDTSQTQKTPAE